MIAQEIRRLNACVLGAAELAKRRHARGLTLLGESAMRKAASVIVENYEGLRSGA